MNWLGFLAAMARLFTSIFSTVRDWTMRAFGETKGRAAAEAEHAAVAEEAGQAMHEIARHPPTREELQKRLEEGNA
jgi:hypothetical protein